MWNIDRKLYNTQNALVGSEWDFLLKKTTKYSNVDISLYINSYTMDTHRLSDQIRLMKQLVCTHICLQSKVSNPVFPKQLIVY